MATKQKHLVIVESPTKARTIERFLGDDYTVHASVGHIRDLPTWGLGVDVRGGTFAPRYEVPKDKRDIVAKLKAAASKADAVYLATDPDREGEAISWHLYEAMDLANSHKPVHRVVFHEITPDAVGAAFAHARDIDQDLVDAQQARRILDRLIGYQLSPLVSKKIRKGKLSAGRVQSVAVRIIIEREREIQAFLPVEYWSIDTDLERQPSAVGRKRFQASLVGHFGVKQKLEVGDATRAAHLVAELEAAVYRVAEVRQKEERRNPSPPFTTSTFQQEAGRKLGLTSKRSMGAAQKLYEGINIGATGEVGLITYMRTDSLNIAESAQREALSFIREKYGAASAPDKARKYTTKSKGAQEAHEAIRPTSVYRTPEAMKPFLTTELHKVYDLVWKRFVASQMASAILDTVAVDIQADAPSGTAYLLRANGSRIKFPGFRAIYMEGNDDDKVEDDERLLPVLEGAEPLTLLPPVHADQHFTQPPPRYTEASLIKAMEERGIGRPSTYAPTISTIVDRGYVDKADRRLAPTELAVEVNDLLEEHFGDIVDEGFTAEMEKDLDGVASGNLEMLAVLKDFYGPFSLTLEKANSEIEVPPVEETGELCPQSGHPMVYRFSKYGRFEACSGFPKCRYAIFPKREAVSTGVTCPRCKQGTLVEKRSTKGRRNVFYGCDRYPDCDYISNDRPVTEPCGLCGGMVVAARAGLKCTECGNVTAVEQAERPPAASPPRARVSPARAPTRTRVKAS